MTRHCRLRSKRANQDKSNLIIMAAVPDNLVFRKEGTVVMNVEKQEEGGRENIVLCSIVDTLEEETP